MKIEVDLSDMGLFVKDFSNKASDIKRKGLELVSQELLRNLVQNSPVDTGLLRGWFPSSMGESEVKIESPASYVGFVNDGTGIYGGGSPITPKNGKALKFQVGGATVFAKSVKGQKGQKFVEKSIEQTSSKIDDILIRVAGEEL